MAVPVPGARDRPLKSPDIVFKSAPQGGWSGQDPSDSPPVRTPDNLLLSPMGLEKHNLDSTNHRAYTICDSCFNLVPRSACLIIM